MSKKIARLFSILAISSTLLISGCDSDAVRLQQEANVGLQQGRQAFQAGNFNAAFQALLVPAQQGNPDAQYAIGYMYFYGKGTEQNPLLARQWFMEASQQGNVQAKQALTTMVKELQKEQSPFSVPANNLVGGGQTHTAPTAPAEKTPAATPTAKTPATVAAPESDNSKNTSNSQSLNSSNVSAN